MATVKLICLVAPLLVSASDLPPIPAGLDTSVVRAIPMQDDGRWPPLDTVARTLVWSVTGDETFAGYDPVALTLAWSFDSAAWRNAPLIRIANAELRHELQLPADKTAFSFLELTSHRPLHALVDELRSAPKGGKPNPLEKKVADIHEKLLTLQSVFSGRALHMIPDPTDPVGAWTPISAAPHGPEYGKVRDAWDAMATAYTAGDTKAFATASARLASDLKSLPTAYRPASKLLATEIHYNTLNPFRSGWELMLIATIFSLASLLTHKRWLDILSIVGMVAGFLAVSYGLWLRWQIAGRIPASNMFESLLFLSWGMGAFAVVGMFLIRHRVVPLTASAMGAVALMLADLLPMNHFIRPIPPVLADTVWMSIHVPVIMVSYSVLALGVLIAHAQLFTMAAFPRKHSVHASLDQWHTWYIHVGSFLLFAGIATGSMWAASSWGRYWGWDPKEVWSLVALLGYLAILHVRINTEAIPRWAYAIGALLAVATFALIVLNFAPYSSAKLFALIAVFVAGGLFVVVHGQFATALKSVLAFWLIIMTYVGVNYVLGTGLHSYGFGTGAVAKHMFQAGGTDLLLVLLCTIVYVWRRQASDPAPTDRSLVVLN
jgi:ABC-type transport system involved in cytochrome c biogenesis permease subunit